MASQNSQGGGSRSQEFTVISHCDPNKKVSIMQFVSDKDFTKSEHISLARENNFKEYKSAYNIDTMPTTGAGSEFGREAKEEARRKKFGYIRRKYNPDAQPWLLQIGAEKGGKRYKGTRNGGILENASYFIFSKRKDGAFEAFPVEEWYNFKPTITYSNLNAEEAEEEFARRDKNLNMFNIMVRKRIKKEDEEEDSKEKVKRDIKSKGLMLTEMEDWGDMSDEGPDAGDSDDAINAKSAKGKGKGKGKGKKKKEKDTDDEAMEDSDDGDKEAKQVDYMSDTSDSDSDMEGRVDKSKYEEKGVEDEEGLREIAAESDEEKEKPEEKKDKEKNSDASSSSSDSESDDPDNEGKGDDFTKAFLMTGSKKDRGKSPVPRSATPTDDRKRKHQVSPRSASPSVKKVKQEVGSVPAVTKPAEGRPSTPVSSAQGARDGLTEESVKRYLLRKPMSSKDLVKLFKAKRLGFSIEELVTRISTILKKLNTKQQKINGVIHFSMGE